MSVRDKLLANRSFGIFDRYIPRSSTSSVYKNIDNGSEMENGVHRRRSRSLSESRYFARIGTTSPNETNSNPQRKTKSSSGTIEVKRTILQKNIADALGYKEGQKVFGYKNNEETNDKSICTPIDIAGPLLSEAPTRDIMRLTAKSKIYSGIRSPSPSPERSLVASSILQAPGLRNDFYSNLVSWSGVANKIAVGLGAHTYLWGADNKIKSVEYESAGPVTCVSFSPKSYLLIATNDGKLFLYNHSKETLVSRFSNRGICIYCIKWFPGKRSKLFLAGNENGEVQIMEVVESASSIHIRLRTKFKCHQQQICGIALNVDCSQIVVGANDNCCSIWEISDFKKPTLKFVLPHSAAVKAIAFCPWTPSLLATGGGSKDRTIRFWHTKTGTLLHSCATNGQITSLIWSKYRKELVTTFGFSDCSKPILIKKYSYPSMTTILEVHATPNLRILSAAVCPDSSSMVVAANDSTVRIYKLWKKSMDIVSSPEFQGCGVYGSDLIELDEGINIKHDSIR